MAGDSMSPLFIWARVASNMGSDREEGRGRITINIVWAAASLACSSVRRGETLGKRALRRGVSNVSVAANKLATSGS